MAKKASKESLHEASQNSASIMDTIAAGIPLPESEQEPEPGPTREPAQPEPINTQDTQGTKYAKPGYYRFNLNMPNEYQNYLKNAAYNASVPNHVVSVTEYINNLIRQDMEKHLKKNLDDLDTQPKEDKA